MTMSPAGTRRRALAAGSAVALGTAALWIMLTAWSGKTYHLAPLLAAAAPGWTARAAGARLNPPSRFATAAAGLAAAGLGWAAIGVLAIEPAATIVHQQPGGVPAEVAAVTLLGVVLGQVALLPGLRRFAGRGARRAPGPARRTSRPCERPARPDPGHLVAAARPPPMRGSGTSRDQSAGSTTRALGPPRQAGVPRPATGHLLFPDSPAESPRPAHEPAPARTPARQPTPCGVPKLCRWS